MQQRFLGATGLSVSRLGLGTMTWGRDTDEHEAREQLVAFVEAGGTLRRHRCRLHRRRLRAAGRLAARRGRARATRSCWPPRPASGGARASGSPTPRAGIWSARWTPRCKRLGVDHVDLWQVHTWVDDAPIEETLTALDLAVTQRPGGVRRGEQLQRLAVRAGGHLAARRPGPGDAGLQPGRVLPAQPRPSRRETIPAARGARPRRTALVAAGARRAHRQVPRRHPGRLPRRLPALLDLRRAATSTSPRSGWSRPWPGRPTGSGGPRSRWPWPGCATGPASPRRSSARAPPPSCASR